MNLTHIKKFFLSVILLCSLFLTTVYTNGSQNMKTTTSEELENVQDQIEDAENKLDEYNDQKDALQNDLKASENSPFLQINEDCHIYPGFPIWHQLTPVLFLQKVEIEFVRKWTSLFQEHIYVDT